MQALAESNMPADAQSAPPPPVPATPRHFRITKRHHVAKYGPTVGCLGCVFRQAHTPACRERIDSKISEDTDMVESVNKYAKRRGGWKASNQRS